MYVSQNYTKQYSEDQLNPGDGSVVEKLWDGICC